MFYKVPHSNHDFRKTCSKCLPRAGCTLQFVSWSYRSLVCIDHNFVTAYSNYLKFCGHKVKILNDKHAKNQVNRMRRTCFSRYQKKKSSRYLYEKSPKMTLFFMSLKSAHLITRFTWFLPCLSFNILTLYLQNFKYFK